MTDSLVNGSLKAFKDFINILAQHNLNSPEDQIRWIGQYITRTRSQAQDDEYYDLLKASGGEGLTIGVESGSDAVRAHMRKQFTTADIDHELAEFDRRGIVCVLLFFSCYPTETWSDFMDTVEMFIKYQRYCASGTIYKLTLGTPYTHHAQTPLWNMQEEIGLTSKKGSDIMWILQSNTELTYRERVRRRLILQEVAQSLGMPMSRNTAELNQLIDSMKNFSQDIQEYFGSESSAELHTDRYALTGHGQVLMTPEIQSMIHAQLTQYPDFKSRIFAQHQEIQDDIRIDNDAYLTLRSMITQ